MHRPLFEVLKLSVLAVAVLVIGYSGLSSFDIFSARTEAETIYGDRDTVPVVRLSPNHHAMREEGSDPETLARDIQARLQRAGCYEGSLDGHWTADTRAAMSRFAAAVNVALPVDQPDRSLLTFLYDHPASTCLASAGETAAKPSVSPVATGSLGPATAERAAGERPTAALTPDEQPRDYAPASNPAPATPEAQPDASSASPSEINLGVGLSKAGPLEMPAAAPVTPDAQQPAAPATVAKADPLARVELLEPSPNAPAKPEPERIIEIGNGKPGASAEPKSEAPKKAGSEGGVVAPAKSCKPAKAAITKPDVGATPDTPDAKKAAAQKAKTAKKSKSNSDDSVSGAISDALYSMGF